MNRVFYLGIFLLPSAPSIGAILLLFTNFIASVKRKNSYFNDYLNLPFFIMGILMVISCLVLSLTQYPLPTPMGQYSFTDAYNKKLLWIGLFNWLPYFWLFWSFQYFTFSPSQRKNIGRILLYGSFPIIFTGIAQYFFKIHGPFVFLNGLVTWYLKPIDSYNGMSGLFSNANYTGTWLSLIWPFSIVFCIERGKKPIETSISFAFLILIFICAFFTFSRNAWIGLAIGFIAILGIKVFKNILPIFITLTIPIFASIGLIPNKFLTDASREIVPSIFWNYKFANIGISSFSNYGRFEIWAYAIKLIIDKPIWGWGSGSFPLLFELEASQYKSHSHNLFLELGLSFGVITALLFISTTIYLIISSYKKRDYKVKNEDKLKNDNYDTAWRTSLIIIFIGQLFDIQYFDLRIGIVFWLLLGGLRNFIK